jgi:hypothetical protein
MITNSFLPAINGNYAKSVSNVSFLRRFIAWCAGQESDRMLWQGIILGVHSCVLTPLALMICLLAGVDNYLWVPVVVAIAPNLVVNLAALPTRITIPVFFLSILADLAVVAAALAYGISL